MSAAGQWAGQRRHHVHKQGRDSGIWTTENGQALILTLTVASFPRSHFVGNLVRENGGHQEYLSSCSRTDIISAFKGNRQVLGGKQVVEPSLGRPA